MKKLIIPLLIVVAFAACQKNTTYPKYVEQVLYSGDSVRYSLDSLPAQLPTAPEDYSDYYRLVQVYSNNTMTVDYSHVLENGLSVTYRMFVRYQNGGYDLKGWYRRQKTNGYIIPANKDVVIYRTVPYEDAIGPDYTD